MYLADYHTHTRISPDAGRSMTEMAEAAIAAGLQEICFTDHMEPLDWGVTTPRESYNWEGLAADFREGWATIYIVKDTHHYYELLNRGSPDDETPLHITGDGPTPKKHATENIPLVAEAIVHFARTGQPLPACGWEESSH